MKWIGQHIYDLTSRFRSDVYLEDVSTGTIASGGNLGLDSNNKIVKAADGGGDLTSIVAGTGLSGTSLTGPIPTLNVDASQTQITGVGTIGTGEWRGTVVNSTYLDADTMHLSGTQDITGEKTIGGEAAPTNKLYFRNSNSYINSPTTNDLEVVATDIVLDAAGSIFMEASDVTMYDPVNDGNPTISLGSSATNRLEIKSTYNSGTQTLCDIDFTTYTDSGTTNDGRYNFFVDEVAKLVINDTTMTAYADITAVDDGARISVQNTTATSATEGGKLRLMADDGAAMADNHRLGVIEFYGAEDASGTDTIGARIEAMCDAAWSASENGARLDFYTTDGNASESKVLTLDSDKLATFAGAVTVTGALTGTLATVSQPNITTLAGVTALGAAGNPLTVTSDQVIFASAAASDPLVNIQNTANDASAPRLRFTKNRGGDAVDADNVGEISFWSYDDGTPSTQQYAFIKAQVHDATSDQESGLLQLGVASHDGDIHVGLSLVGGDEDGNINVNLGLGANSAINIPGNIDLAGDIDVDGTLETDALTIGGATIAAIGTTAITTLGTIGTGVWEGTAIATNVQKHLMHYNTTGYSNGSTEYQISEAMNVNPVGSVEHDTNIGSDGLTAQTVQTWLRSGGHVMPRACTLKRWSGWSTSPTTGDDPTYGLFKVTLEDDVDSDPSAELITEMTIVASGNPIANFYSITTASSGNADDLDIAAGDIVFFAIKGGGAWIYFNGTFEVEF